MEFDVFAGGIVVNTAQKIVLRMVSRGLIAPEHLEEATKALDLELRRRSRRTAQSFAARVAASAYMLRFADMLPSHS